MAHLGPIWQMLGPHTAEMPTNNRGTTIQAETFESAGSNVIAAMLNAVKQQAVSLFRGTGIGKSLEAEAQRQAVSDLSAQVMPILGLLTLGALILAVVTRSRAMMIAALIGFVTVGLGWSVGRGPLNPPVSRNGQGG